MSCLTEQVGGEKVIRSARVCSSHYRRLFTTRKLVCLATLRLPRRTVWMTYQTMPNHSEVLTKLTHIRDRRSNEDTCGVPRQPLPETYVSV